MDYGIQVPGAYGKPDESDAVGLVHAALDAGINFIDTARAYGASETVLGKALRGRRDQVVLATKATTRLPDGAMPGGAALRELLLSQLDISLKELQSDFVDIWQLHNVAQEELEQWEAIGSVFAEVKQSGKVHWVGGSFYGSEMPERALAHEWLDLIQVTYSVFDQRLADRVFPLAQEKNVGVTVRSVLLQGALTKRADYLPDHLDLLRAHSRTYRQLVADFDLSLNPAQVALAFALSHPQIDAALVGVRTIEELEENLAAVDKPLPQEYLQQLYPLRIDDDTLLNPGTWAAK